MESRDEVHNRRRNARGQYLPRQSSIPVNADAVLRRKQARRDRTARTRNAGLTAFSSMIECIFLRGSDNDWVPGDAGDGPVNMLATSLFRCNYLPVQHVRSELVRRVYFEYRHGMEQKDIPWMMIYNGTTGKKYHKRVFKKRRLPKLSCSREMRYLKEWIRKALEDRILKVDSFEAVYEVFRKYLLSYKCHGTSKRYDEYPSKERSRGARVAEIDENIITPDSDGSVPFLDGGLESTALSGAVTGAFGDSNNNTTASGEVGQYETTNGNHRVTIANLLAPSGVVVQGRVTEEERTTAFQLYRVFCTASDSRLFFLLCKVADDTVDSMVFCAAPAILKRHREGRIKLDMLLVDALTYVYELHFGVNILCEHRARKERILISVQLLKLVRRCLKLPSYEEMMFRDFL